MIAENTVLRTPDGQSMFVVPAGMSDRHFMAHGFQYGVLPQYLRHTGTDPLADGSWGGKRCFVVGCGPSLQGFDFDKLRGEKVIAINHAFLFIPFASISISGDTGWMINVQSAGIDADVAEAYSRFDGIKMFVNRDWLRRPPEVQEVLVYDGTGRFSPSIHEGLCMSATSAFPALNLALTLGATEIYLMGIDLTNIEHGDKCHFYDDGENPPIAAYQVAVPVFDEASKDVPAMWPEARIIQTNRNSNLKCFEFGDLPV